ncbi:MAG TPA: hypothetical protein VN578_08690 [Candidatus Binatia bacterium]|jgi:hypothetical protein|nr:hypothetical protein [Candidatus Binatia bacterium]
MRTPIANDQLLPERTPSLIDTPLQRGGPTGREGQNRFSGFSPALKPQGFSLRILLWLLATLASSFAADRTGVILVVGAPGEPEFATNFVRQASLWETACARAECRHITIGLAPNGLTNDYDLLKQTLAAEPTNGLGQLWLVLIGHGTFDGKEAWFNLRGPDVSAGDLALWLKPFQRPLALINTASASAPFLAKLSATNRVIITATRSGNEQNFARFGQFFAEALTNSEADLDHDGQISLLEAFLTASRQVAEFYKVEGRLATEHALLDDNGDALGTPADWFTGLRATKRAKENAPLDGLLARQWYLIASDAERKLSPEQRARRDALEREVFLLRDKKAQMDEGTYYRQLEKLLLDLARSNDAT